MTDSMRYHLAHLALCLLVVGAALGIMTHGSWDIPVTSPGVAHLAALVKVALFAA